jgi:hypothetical protein
VKTISVYDAVKLATKGPLKVMPAGQVMNPVYQLVCNSGRYVCRVDAELSGEPSDENGVNALLMAHFFNHGPALLAMLEEFVKLYEPFRKQLDANETEILDESIALIAKASKVEIEE